MFTVITSLLRKPLLKYLSVFGLLVPLLQAQAPYQLGDIDADGQPTVYDLTQLIALYKGEIELTDSLKPYSDLNQDGKTDLTDIYLLRDAVLKRIDLPVPDITPELDSESESTSMPTYRMLGSTWPGSQVLIEGGKSPIIVNTDANGNFEVEVELNKNSINKLFITAINSNGDASHPQSIDVTHDSVPPDLFIDFPADNEELITAMADIAGRIGDVLSGYQGLDVKVNGESAEVIVGIGQNGTFEKGGIPLEVGKNVVSVTAKDMLGNSVTKTKTLYRIVPQGPTISAFTGNGQTGIIHTGLPQAVKVKVQYPNGAPVAYKWVDYKVIRSNGLLSTNPVDFSEAKQTIQLRTDEDGEAFAYWRMGSDAGCGNNRIQVTSKDVAGTAYFCASANPRPAEQINIGSGNDQRGAADTNAIDLLRVWVNDTCNGVKDIPVIFTVISGGGKVNGEDETIAVTSITGHAGVSFKYGPNTGNNVIQATFDGNTGPPATFVLFGAASDSTVPTSFSGVVFDNSNQPIGGVRCQLEIGGEFLPPVLSGRRMPQVITLRKA